MLLFICFILGLLVGIVIAILNVYLLLSYRTEIQHAVTPYLPRKSGVLLDHNDKQMDRDELIARADEDGIDLSLEDLLK